VKKSECLLVPLLLFSVVLVSFLSIKVDAQARTIVVPDDYKTIQEAIDFASNGDTVFVKNGIYSEPIEVHKPLTLLGEDNQNTILEILMIRYWPPRVILVNADNVTVSGFNIINSDIGIWLDKLDSEYEGEPPDNCKIIGNNFVNNSGAIRYFEGTNLTISENHITTTRGTCISLSSSNCLVSNNNITNNFDSAISGNDYNITIKDNTIKNNTEGIGLSNSNHWYIYKNTLTDNEVGIKFSRCNNSTIIQNNIEGNNIGIELENIQETDENPLGSGNIAYFNNFIDNSQQVLANKEYWLPQRYNTSIVNGTTTVTWDNGTFGNYWNNYEERYPNATELDNSGIWNTPYLLDENNQDNYSLMEPVIIPESFSLTVFLVMAVFLVMVIVIGGVTIIYKHNLEKSRR
jgi:nitrous oxidase accessory protein